MVRGAWEGALVSESRCRRARERGGEGGRGETDTSGVGGERWGEAGESVCRMVTPRT